eukprot:CAMPEP_0176379258 /NCGR_PEP_ID=MMETSP0126-20121128/30232_1 /TAXON_ID=141414 ORGANISM="Strombidinopsis acuminatum, Strain SPMC142" /NCGR_SAMPLE_ID=MMETSP0126 /ASSEMBLY_ACC=CAM_ASM_000229 /LENGTH=53 /DNA_ID=CAMNT_0017741963 /DNA_START=280 /DNA_END=441 /DNA_ORIENTATION=-
MANASLKWNNHVTNILQGLEGKIKPQDMEARDDEDEDDLDKESENEGADAAES